MSLGDELRRLADELPEALEIAELASLHDGLELAHEFSGGDLTPADLRSLDHPYARRHGTALRDPHRVNRQSGDFQAAWDSEGPTLSGDRMESSLFNTDPKADLYLEYGTEKMVPRQPHEKVAGILEPRRQARIERAIERTLEG